ncbi:MAG TPA: AMIN domain-containing protein, partial [Allocoleopsis sp.]
MKITSLSIPLSLIAIATTNLPIMAGTLEKWNFDTKTNQLEIKIKDGVKPNYFILSQPPRIVIDLPRTQLGKVATNQLFNSGTIQQVRLSQFTPDITRIVLELSPDTNLNQENVKIISKSPNNEHWLVQTKITAKPPNINNTLPPASFDKNLPITVTVPPLESKESKESSTVITVEKSPESVPPIITVPPVPSTNNSSVKKAKIITFGEPLPPEEKLEIITPTPPESII